MRKTYNIRWRESDVEKLQRKINNFNQRLYRQQKKKPDAQHLPARKNLKSEAEKVQTRAEFNSLLKALDRFTAKTAQPAKNKNKKSAAKISKWGVQEDIRQQKIHKKREMARAEALKEKEVTQGGKGTGKTRAEMGKLREQPTNIPIYDPTTMKQEEWETHRKYVENALKPSYSYEKAMMFQKNYIKGLIRVGMPKDVIDMLQRVDPAKFVEIIETDEYATFDFIYDPAGVAAVADLLRETWADAAGENYAIDSDRESAIETEVETEAMQGYFGRHYTKDWAKWEREHWGNKRMKRRKKKK